VTRLPAEWLWCWGSIPGRVQKFFFSHQVQAGCGSHPALSPVNIGNFCLRGTANRGVKPVIHMRLHIKCPLLFVIKRAVCRQILVKHPNKMSSKSVKIFLICYMRTERHTNICTYIYLRSYETLLPLYQTTRRHIQQHRDLIKVYFSFRRESWLQASVLDFGEIWFGS
jgi:hypothetical protein